MVSMTGQNALKVLLVETSPGQLDAHHKLLNKVCNVKSCDLQNNPVELIYKFSPEIMVMALDAPLPEAEELMSDVREHMNQKHLYILILCADFPETRKALYFDLGANMVFEKNISMRTFQSLMESANAYVIQIRLMNLTHMRFTEELNLIKNLQLKLLPKGAYTHRNIKITSLYQPSDFASGDYFDYFTSDEVTKILLADVSGHGTKAAFIMAMLKGLFKASFVKNAPVELALQNLNDMMLDFFEGHGDFVTAIGLELDHKANTLKYVNAGHCPGLMVTDNREVALLKSQSPPLGFFKQELESTTIEAADNFKILLYTDGFYEWDVEPGKPFGMEWFIDFTGNLLKSKTIYLEMLMEAICNIPPMRPIFNDDVSAVLVERSKK